MHEELEELIKRMRDSEHEIDCSLCDRDCCYPDGNVHGKCIIIEAADAIEEMSRLHEAQRQNLITLMNEEPEPKWIPVTERLPKEQETVLIWGEQGIILLNWLHDNKWCCCLGDVTHWMPLPEPPKEEN
jgi:hypothetical protein